ncbi:RodZ domain-containing protein [Pseudomonas sp. BMS12]|uniref:RodZ domain-containing protein n=1 Tax=Pseudomonas sp. BMS12 TaxID=1796033 RepID=UPI0009EF3CD3|nr:RodZ family helix-turn-helix domain-containing protein [Pseudomonas sp. BMS12]
MKTSHPEVATAHRVNPGETLRKVRESRSMALGDVAAQLNLTAQALRHLEAGDFEQLPGHTFARGYVRAYAKLMAMDPSRLVDEFDQYTGTNASGSSVASLSRIEEPARVSQGILKFFSIVALLALGAAGFFWWQDQARRVDVPGNAGPAHVEVEAADGTVEIHSLAEPEDQAVAEAQNAESSLPAPDELAPAEPAATVVSDADAGETVVAVPPVSEAVTPAPAETVDEGSAAEAAEPVAAIPSPAPVSAAAGEAVVNLQFTADCWTQLTDADGQILLSSLKRRGDSVELAGKAPLELRLGFARGAVVLVNGKPVDLAPHIHGETARLSLGQ